MGWGFTPETNVRGAKDYGNYFNTVKLEHKEAHCPSTSRLRSIGQYTLTVLRSHVPGHLFKTC
jgi:hypothetical protein